MGTLSSERDAKITDANIKQAKTEERSAIEKQMAKEPFFWIGWLRADVDKVQDTQLRDGMVHTIELLKESLSASK